jgi:hypothetical protein
VNEARSRFLVHGFAMREFARCVEFFVKRWVRPETEVRRIFSIEIRDEPVREVVKRHSRVALVAQSRHTVRVDVTFFAESDIAPCG